MSAKSFESLWLKNKTFDLWFFHLSGLLCLFLLIPYLTHGQKVVFPIYNLYLVFFGLPHNYMTWASFLPKTTRKFYDLRVIKVAAVICLILCFMLPFCEGTDLNNWILTLITMYSLWHAYRQHHGILKIYDVIQAKRFEDTSIYHARKTSHLFFGLSSFAVVVWAFTHPQIIYLLSPDERYKVIYPQIPHSFYQIYLAVCITLGVKTLKDLIWDRKKEGKFIPYPQLLLMFIALATYIVPYFFIPIEAMPLAVAIGTIYHNIQYFGFVWYFEKTRGEILVGKGIELPWPQQMVYSGHWKKWFSVAMAYSFMVVGIYFITPRWFGLHFIYYLAFAHYVIDGYVWRKDQNIRLNEVVGAWIVPKLQGKTI